MKKIILLLVLSSTYIFSNINTVVSILPEKTFVKAVGGDKVNVALMVMPGHSPHTYEPKPSQMKEIAKGAKAALVVEASPALEQVIKARKSIASFEIRVYGKAGHASRPAEGASAIKAMAEVILRLYTLQDIKRGISGLFLPAICRSKNMRQCASVSLDSIVTRIILLP